jgi:type II secretory pathway predicted ATPase ExeA
MYEQVFQFNARPFTATPYVKHYFAGDAIHNALGQARVCIDRASGPVIVVGGTGTGKSLLLASLEEQYQSQFDVVNLACARLGDRRELLQSILFELQLPFKADQESDLRFELMDFLSPSERCPNGVLLLVDEAHSLSTDLLDELRLIMNFVRDGQPRVRLVMAGSQRLEENLNDPKLDSFNQRIAARCYLQNMSRDETANYVTEHIDRVGGSGAELFAPESLKAIHEVSDGCPRLINQVCDQALIVAATHGLQVVSADCIEDAWADVQCIPGTRKSGSNQDQQSTTAALETDEQWTVIEFGQLDDESASDEMFHGETDSVESSSEVDSSTEPACESELGECELEESDSNETESSDSEILEFAVSQSDSDSQSATEPMEKSWDHESESLEFQSDITQEEEHVEAADEAVVSEETSADDSEETFVGLGGGSTVEEEVNSLIDIESNESLSTSSLSTQLESDCETSSTDSEPAQETCSELETSESTNDMAAELAAVFGNVDVDPISDEDATSSASIEDLEDEQQQIFEQVEEEQESAFAGIGVAKNEVEGSVFGVVDDHEDSDSHIQDDDPTSEADQEFENSESHSQDHPVEMVETVDIEHSETVAKESTEEPMEEPTPKLRQPVETVDPFSEQFAEEENLIDRFAPFVAHQNQSSLSVTSEELSMLRPNDEQEETSEEASTQVSGYTFVSESELPNERGSTEESEHSSIMEMGSQDSAEPEETFPTFEQNSELNSDEAEVAEPTFAETSEPSDSDQLETHDSQSNLQSDSTQDNQEEGQQLHEHVSAAESPDIQHQAAEILKRLNLSNAVSHETESTDSNSLQDDTPNAEPQVEPVAGESTSYDSEFDRQSAALDESQQILNEILEQKNALSQQRDATVSQDPASIKMDEGVGGESSHSPNEAKDDREMIIVNRMEQPVKSESTESHAEPVVPFPTTPVSTGRAERMDYQKLFDQLRDISNSQE